MAILQTGQSFSSGDQVTATKLQDIANLATFITGTNQTADDSTIQVDGSGGYLKVKSSGITSNELATDSVITAKIQDDAVITSKILDQNITLAKIQNINTTKVLGRTSSGAGIIEEIPILDEDDMVSDSDTSLVTQQSIKAYVESQAIDLNVFAKGFIDTSNGVHRATNIVSSSYSSGTFTITFTNAAQSPHATYIVQVTPRVSSNTTVANYTLGYLWNTNTQLEVDVAGLSNLDGISLTIFE